MKKYDVITFGSGLVDAFIYTGVKEKNGRISFPSGTKIRVHEIDFGIGGGGINTAIAFADLGLKTGFLGKIGSGNNADIILRELKNNKIDFLGVKSHIHTGYSIVLESDKKNRTILTFKGASDTLDYREIDLKKINTRWIHFTSMGDGSFETQKKLIDYAIRKKIKISFNPSSYQTSKGVQHIKKFIENSYFLSMNKEEASMLIKRGDPFKELYKLGAKIVCITNGEKEGGVYDGEFLYRYFPNKGKIGGVTGAGDVFASSFVAGILRTQNIEKALRLAMANAALKISKTRGKYELMNWSEAQKAMNSKKYKIIK
ncbi:MAG: carbohydrate kinase family protein [Candidatus Pacearchaeota archaeon]